MSIYHGSASFLLLLSIVFQTLPVADEKRKVFNNEDEQELLMSLLETSKCVPMPRALSVCRSIGYERMYLPNQIGHDNPDDISQLFRQLQPLIDTGCHQDAVLFLCSLLAPVCVNDDDDGNNVVVVDERGTSVAQLPSRRRVIPPCRSFCRNVFDNCSMLLRKQGFAWPRKMTCARLPEDNMCIAEDMLRRHMDVQITDVQTPASGEPTTSSLNKSSAAVLDARPTRDRSCVWLCNRNAIMLRFKKLYCSSEVVGKFAIQSYNRSSGKLTVMHKSTIRKPSGYRDLKRDWNVRTLRLNCSCVRVKPGQLVLIFWRPGGRPPLAMLRLSGGEKHRKQLLSKLDIARKACRAGKNKKKK